MGVCSIQVIGMIVVEFLCVAVGLIVRIRIVSGRLIREQ